MATITLDNYFMAMEAVGAPNSFNRKIKFLLYSGRNNIQAITGAVSVIQNVEGFAVWKNGESGSSIIANSDNDVMVNNKSRFSIQTAIHYTLARFVNQVDRWTFTYAGDNYIINISDANILRIFSRAVFRTYTPDILFSTFPQGSLISARIADQLTVTLLTPQNNILYDIFWTDIEGIVNATPPTLPVVMALRSNTFTFAGDLSEFDLIKVKYSIGRSSGFAKYTITLDVLDFIPEPPVLPPPITEISYTMLIGNVRLVGDKLKGTLSIDPPLPTDHSEAVQIVYRQTAPDRLLTVRTTIVYTGNGEYDLLDILAGQHFTFYWRTTFRNPTRLISSPTYNYMRMDETVIPDPTVTQEAELSDSKIYLDRLGATSLSLLIINDLFNTDDVSKVVIGITGSSGTSIQEKANTVFDARIEIDITGLTQETDYSLEVQIVYNEVNKTIATLKVTTLKSLTSNSSDAEKQLYTRQNFTRRNYDKEDVDLIENLPTAEWLTVVTNAIQQMNDPQSDQLPHDLNKFNRRGSVHNAPRSPSPTGNFVGLLSVRIAEESGAIPDIDEGYA